MNKGYTQLQSTGRAYIRSCFGKVFGNTHWRFFVTRMIHTLVVVSLLLSNFVGVVWRVQASQVDGSQDGEVQVLETTVTENGAANAPGLYQRPTIDRPEPRTGNRPSNKFNLQTLDNVLVGAAVQSRAPENSTNTSPMVFVQNVGQFDPRVLYEVKNDQGIIRIAKDGIWVTLLDANSLKPETQQTEYDFDRKDGKNPDHIESQVIVNGVHMHLLLEGASNIDIPEGLGRVDTTISYFYGDDPLNWHANVPVFSGVRYTDIYPGVDLEIVSREGQWTWDFIVRDSVRFDTEAGPISENGIRLKVDGIDSMKALDDGVYAQTAEGEFRLPKFEVTNNGDRRKLDIAPTENNELILPIGIAESISGSAPVRVSTKVLMKIESPALNQPAPLFSPDALMRDESLTSEDLLYSTYLGGSGGEYATSIKVDSSFAAYVTGYTSSTNFPTSSGAFTETLAGGFDTFVSKLNSDGTSLVYSTYIGGNADDFSWEIALDDNENAYIVGRANSTNFPVTIGSSDGGAFVTKLNTDGTDLIYSRFVGGSGGEQGFGIAVSPIGEAYITGQTYSTDFPVTQGAFDTTFNNGYWDGFIAKLGTSGQIVYATYIGGSGGDCETGGDYKECTIAIDITGAAYITGPTYSSNFPVKGDAINSTHNGGQDGFVLKLNPEGSDLVYSTYFGGENNECNETCKIAITASGEAFVAGSVGSGTTWQAFLAKFSSNGSIMGSYSITGMEMARNVAVGGIGEVYVIGDSSPDPYRDVQISNVINTTMYTTYLGGSNDEIGYGIALDRVGATYIAGYTHSNDFPTTPGAFQTTGGFIDAYVTKIAQAAYSIIDEVGSSPFCGGRKGAGDGRDCPVPSEQSQGTIGDPINTRNGDFVLGYTDLSIATPAGSLVFERSYSSLSVDRFTSLMGYGWTHNHDTRLIFSDDPGGEADTVLFKSHTTNLHKFIDHGDDTFTAYPGVLSSLVKNPGTPATYTLTDSIQRTYDFDEDGKLTHWNDADGFGWTYSYDENGRLDRVTDDTTQRYLDLDYDGQGRVESVTDHTGREISFGYNVDGDLETFVDVLDQTWTYTYDEDHRLRLVTDPATKSVVHTEYDGQGRAYQQYLPDETLALTVTYSSIYSTTIITNALGIQTIDVYDARKTFTNQVNEQNKMTGRTYDANFRPTAIVDENSNGAYLTWSDDGANLTQSIDALGNQIDLEYDGLNNLIAITDARQFLTTYVYSGSLLISSTDPYTHTTIYTYTTSADTPQPPGLLKAVRDPNGQVVQYEYDQYGQRIATTDQQGLATEYAYDDLGRVVNITLPSGISNWTCHDQAGRIVRTVGNASGDGGTPQTDPCDTANYTPSADPIFDRITTTDYDDSGNVIATTDPNGIINRTYFDDNNRPSITIQNLYGQSIETSTPPSYDPDYPNRNIRQETVYDDAGQVIATIDPLNHITRTYYDSLGRPQYIVQNLVGQDIEVATPPSYDSQYPDRNIRTETVYDSAGNAIAMIDTLGRITRTYYDSLNRPRYVVQNLVGQAIEVSTPPAYDPQYPDRNVRMETVYDEAGNTIANIDTLGQITRTYYDALNRAETVVQNLSGQNIGVETPPDFNPAYPDQNVRTDYGYDQGGNLIATIDPNGIVNRTYHDTYGRAYLIVSNLSGQAIDSPTPPIFNPTYPDQNVRTETIYDDGGYVIATIDTLGKISRTYYDDLYRPTIVVSNLISETGSITETIEHPTPPLFDPSHPDQNVRTETVYGADGKVIANIANDGAITRSYYDELGRPVVVVRNLYAQSIDEATPPTFDPDHPDRNVRTETVYGPGGFVARTIDVDGKVTHSCYDGLYRVVATVINPTVDDPCESYSPSNDPDKDIVLSTTYNGIGNSLATTDPTGKTTAYEYDALNRLTAEIDPLQHRTSYGYDGNWNRVALTDANNTVTRYEYDDLSRLTAVIENYLQGITPDQETNVRTEYTYDAIGNRLTIKDALNHVTSFDFDDLGRLISESDPLTNATTYTYDGAGNRVAVLDANGSTTAYLYDGLYRPVTIDYPDPDGDVQFSYDSAGNRAVMTDTLGITEWAYDGLNRPIRVTDPFSGTVGYGYDGLGRRTALNYPDGKVVSYSYDEVGRMIQASDWHTQTITYTYDKAGRLLEEGRPGGIGSTYVYDPGDRLQAITHTLNSTQTLSAFNYTYDPVGNRTSVNGLPASAVPDRIFADDFETGDLSAWSSSVTDGGDLRVITQTAIAGSYSLLAEIDDNNLIYVTDESPESESHYRARFYFDPNFASLTMGTSGQMIFQAYQQNGTGVVRLALRNSAGDIQIRLEGMMNGPYGYTYWIGTPWIVIHDQLHALEIEWQAATGAEANDGLARLWVDGVKVGELLTLNGYDHSIDYVRLGAVDVVYNDTRGTLLFDAFDSRQETYIGLDAGISIPPPSEPGDAIFADGFESGDLSAWSQAVSYHLSVTTTAAYTGTYGMQALISDNSSIYVTDWGPFEEKHYRARFYFDPNSITMGNNNNHYIFVGYDRSDIMIFRIEFEYSSGNYRLRSTVKEDSIYRYIGITNIDDNPHAIEIEWQAATAAGANDGVIKLWVDGVQKLSNQALDNDTTQVDYVRLGAVFGVDTGTRGTYYFDAFESNS